MESSRGSLSILSRLSALKTQAPPLPLRGAGSAALRSSSLSGATGSAGATGAAGNAAPVPLRAMASCPVCRVRPVCPVYGSLRWLRSGGLPPKKKSPYLTPWLERSGDFRRGLLRVAQNSKIPREAEFHNLPPCGSKIRDKPPGGAERRSGGRYGRIGVWQNRKTKLRARPVKNRRRNCRPGRGRPRTVCASGCM